MQTSSWPVFSTIFHHRSQIFKTFSAFLLYWYTGRSCSAGGSWQVIAKFTHYLSVFLCNSIKHMREFIDWKEWKQLVVQAVERGFFGGAREGKDRCLYRGLPNRNPLNRPYCRLERKRIRSSCFVVAQSFFSESGRSQCGPVKAVHIWVLWFWADWRWNNYCIHTNVAGAWLYECCTYQTRGNWLNICDLISRNKVAL